MPKKILVCIFLLTRLMTHAQTIYFSSIIDFPVSSSVYSLNLSSCNYTELYMCGPTEDTLNAPNLSYTDMACDGQYFYFVTGGSGNLYRQNITGSPACQYLGSFNYSINSLIADTLGIIYGVGQQNGVCKLFKYQSGNFSSVGNFPSNYFSAGDLFFYDSRLFLTGTSALLDSAYLVEVDMLNPWQSCMYMRLQNFQSYGAFSIHNGSNSRAFVVTVTYISQNNYISSFMELDIPCKTIGNVLCTFPIAVAGAAAYYPYTSNNSVATCSTSMAPNLSVAGNLSLCAGQTTTLTAQGANTYTWSTNAITHSVVLQPSVTTTYTLEGAFTGGCVSNTIAVTVSVTPSFLSVSGPTAVCKDETIVLTASGANSYTWNSGPTAASIAVTPSINTTFTLSGTSNNCISTLLHQVTVHTPANIDLAPTHTVCYGNGVTLTASGVISYTWSSNENTDAIAVTPLKDTVFSLTGTDLNDCLVQTATSVHVLSVPSLSLSGNFSVCPGESTSLMVSGAASYTWSSGENSNIIKLEPFVTSDYTVSGSSENTCVSSKTVQVLVNPLPNLIFKPHFKIGPGESATLTVAGGINYLWDPDLFLSCKTCSNPVASPDITTSYCVIADSLTCKAKVCITVEVSCEGGDLSMPNAFSPDGDGLNDAFCLQGWDVCISGFSIYIYNRWGENVYQSIDPSFCWDGFYKGKALSKDVYVYVVEAKFTDGRSVKRKGNITLL